MEITVLDQKVALIREKTTYYFADSAMSYTKFFF